MVLLKGGDCRFGLKQKPTWNFLVLPLSQVYTFYSGENYFLTHVAQASLAEDDLEPLFLLPPTSKWHMCQGLTPRLPESCSRDV